MSVVNPVNIHRYKLFNKTIFKVVCTKYYNSWIFLKIFKFTKYNHNKQSWDRLTSKHKKENLLYIDQSLGGGTALYSADKVQKLSEEYDVIICQYDMFLKKYVFSAYPDNMFFVTKIFPDNILDGFNKIIINNLVGYPDLSGVLNIITNAKNKNAELNIDFMVHDFYCVCPTVHLIKPDLTTCATRDCVVCTKCQKNIVFWENMWGRFLNCVADSVIVFSNNSKKMLLSVYPQIDSKIKIIPHTITNMRKVRIKKHDDINIAIIGGLYGIKGQKFVCDMLPFLPKNVNIVHIGEFYGAAPRHPQFICVGPYDLKTLPDIVEKYAADIAFIASIVPETFSFTTSECMNMGLPVACFNIGAPAERVSKYEYGLIISKMDAKIALKEILDFVNKIKNGSLNE